MSAAEIRAELAAAATSVDGVTCNPYYVQMSQPGQACVRRDRIEYPNVFGGVGWWNVIVCLPQDMAAAEAFFDNQIPTIVEALKPVLVIKSATPNKLTLVDGTTVLAAFINGFREE